MVLALARNAFIKGLMVTKTVAAGKNRRAEIVIRPD